jgi:hypothetical protein
VAGELSSRRRRFWLTGLFLDRFAPAGEMVVTLATFIEGVAA